MPTGLLDLPNEILFDILHQALRAKRGIKSRRAVHIGRVCRRFNTIITQLLYSKCDVELYDSWDWSRRDHIMRFRRHGESKSTGFNRAFKELDLYKTHGKFVNQLTLEVYPLTSRKQFKAIVKAPYLVLANPDMLANGLPIETTTSLSNFASILINSFPNLTSLTIGNRRPMPIRQGPLIDTLVNVFTTCIYLKSLTLTLYLTNNLCEPPGPYIPQQLFSNSTSTHPKQFAPIQNLTLDLLFEFGADWFLFSLSHVLPAPSAASIKTLTFRYGDERRIRQLPAYAAANHLVKGIIASERRIQLASLRSLKFFLTRDSKWAFDEHFEILRPELVKTKIHLRDDMSDAASLRLTFPKFEGPHMSDYRIRWTENVLGDFLPWSFSLGGSFNRHHAWVSHRPE